MMMTRTRKYRTYNGVLARLRREGFTFTEAESLLSTAGAHGIAALDRVHAGVWEDFTVEWEPNADYPFLLTIDTRPADIYLFMDAGIISGTQYVDVLTEDYDPMQYGIPLDEAIRDYGNQRIMRKETT